MIAALQRAVSSAGAAMVVAAFLLVSSLRADGDLPLLEPSRFDRDAAAHLLSRAAFGGTPEEIDALHSLGLEKAGESLFEVEATDPAREFEPSFTETPDRRRFRGLSREERQKLQREIRQKDSRQLQALRAWWFRRMVLSPRPLEEKMTLFWHGHFATSQQDVRNSYHMYLQNRTLRSMALGSFRDLVRAVAKDPAMLRYLDNNRNIRRRPNENFARELMELFTLGVGNYTEEDIKEAARALTGWTFRGNEFVFVRRAHDPEEKSFLGRKGRFTGDDIIDIIFEQPASSRFIARKLFIFFAHDDPPESAVESLAATLRENDFDIRPVLSKLFRSREFYSAKSRANQIKSPVHLVVGSMRLLGIDPGSSPAGAFLAGRMGQELFAPPSVKGWDGGEAWVSTSTLFDRYNLSAALLGTGVPEGRARRRPAPGAGRFAARNVPRWNRSEVERRILGEDPGALTPAEVVERAARYFLRAPLTEDALKELKAFYTGADPERRFAELIHLILSSPEYQVG